ncbi:unnamed protein product [Cylicocyclus nassatus]|uniref:Uncharacterized protein n=1 Tax=Cylicocyclus nassatus TaxID=53992 RepID=A0AA36GNA8_CYLNA|nr:unnamed protein product [Cylicocyclus nassatus]
MRTIQTIVPNFAEHNMSIRMINEKYAKDYATRLQMYIDNQCSRDHTSEESQKIIIVLSFIIVAMAATIMILFVVHCRYRRRLLHRNQPEIEVDLLRNHPTFREVITLSDSPLEHLNVVPVAISATPDPAKENLPSWAPLARHSTTSAPATPVPPPKYLPMPVRHISPASEAELEKAGFDPLEGSSLRYPANEYLRQYEMDIVKSCIAVNSTISLPLAVSADHICAVVVVNFLRWFPRSRAIYCCNSLEAAEVFRERGAAVGIITEEISTIDTFQTFKKLPTHKIGRVIVTTPQTFEKIVESDSTVVEDIRCVVFCLEASENLRFTKYKNIVGALTVKGILFRVLLVTPSVPSTSRKIGPLRKRQQLITSLLISQWIEPPASDPSFRNHSIPLGLSIEYCENVEILSETRSFIEKWIERSATYLEKLHALIPLPSTRPDQLFTLDWGQIAMKANFLPNDTVQLVVNCMFLVEAARNLIINGPRVFLLYCIDLFGKAEEDSRAGLIQLMILEDALLSRIYHEIQSKYLYNTDSIFNISFNSLSLNSHPKFHRIKKILAKFPSPLRCLVLCENGFVSKVVCESNNDTPRFRNSIVRVLAHEGPPAAFRKYHRLPTQCTGLFSRTNDDVIVVMGMDIADVHSIIDTMCSNNLHVVISMDRSGQHTAILNEEFEKLRPMDGRILKATDELSCRRSSLFGSTGISAIDRYNFSFEFSRLQLASSKMELVQYLPNSARTADAGGAVECPHRHGFELTSAEFSEYCDRLAALPAVPRGVYTRNHGLALLGEKFDDIDAQNPENFGDVSSSTLSERLMDYNKGMEAIKKRRKTLFSYTDELVDKEKIEFYGSLIEKLDKLLSI